MAGRAFSSFLLLLIVVAAPVSALGLPSVSAGQKAEPPRLVSYQAKYRLTLVRPDPIGEVVAGDGDLRIDFADVCDGYTLTQRLRTRTADDAGDTIDSDFIATSFESRDGKRFQFNIRNWVNGTLVESYNGIARVPKPGGPGRATFTEPRMAPLALPAGTVFPTGQLILLLRAAAAGKHFVSVPIFDGSGQAGISETGSFIGNRRPPAGRSVPAALKGVRSWPVRMAYFSADRYAMRPDYEIGFRLFANGVSTDLELDFRAFAFEGTLTALRLLPPFPCHHG